MLERLRADRLPNREPIWIAVDALLAAGLCIVALDEVRSDRFVDAYGEIGGAGLVLVLGPSALVLIRRAAPAPVLALATVMSIVAGVRHGESDALNAGPFLAYLVAATRAPAGSAIIVAAAAVSISTLGFYGPGPVEWSVPLAAVVLYGVAWAAGARTRSNRDRAEQLAADVRRVRVEADEYARRAVVDERSRIARELHDAVGHAVNVMVMQAGAGRLVTHEHGAVSAFRNIERVGRLALADLDRMLGLLDDAGGDGSAPRAPTHGMADIATLVENVRAGGASIELHDDCSGRLDPIGDRPISAAAYRIVQEAVTNAVKHAGSAHIVVRLSCDEESTTVEITDDGRGAAATVGASGGRGLAGMHERVAILGGSLRAGPRPGGGYRVTARLPRDGRP